MTEPLVASLVASLVLAAVQLAPRVLPEGDTGDDAPLRSLSLAGGFSVAFVFLHLLPELEEAGDPVADALGHLLPFIEAAAHLLALVGLITLYGLERFARSTPAEADAVDRTVRVEVAAFACYYSIVGLLTWDRAASGLGELVTFTIAVGLHFLVVDWRSPAVDAARIGGSCARSSARHFSRGGPSALPSTSPVRRSAP